MHFHISIDYPICMYHHGLVWLEWIWIFNYHGPLVKMVQILAMSSHNAMQADSTEQWAMLDDMIERLKHSLTLAAVGLYLARWVHTFTTYFIKFQMFRAIITHTERLGWSNASLRIFRTKTVAAYYRTQSTRRDTRLYFYFTIYRWITVYRGMCI